MRLILILTLTFIMPNVANAKKNSDFEIALFDCFMRYSDQRNKEGDGEAYLNFKKRAYKVLKTDEIKPTNPLETGMDPTKGLDEAMISYRRLLRLTNNPEYIKQNPDIIAHLHCQFDIWMLESESDWNTKVHIEEAKKSFLHNIESLENQYFAETTDDQIDKLGVPSEQNLGFTDGQCLTLLFDERKYQINDISSDIVEKILAKRKDFSPYGILITGFVDWNKEGHYAMISAKKRMVTIKDFLIASGVKKEKITGDIVEILTKECKETRNIKTRICVFNILKHGKIGKQFLNIIDFSEDGTKNPKEKIKKG